MSKLLISEPPLQVLPSLAVEIGLNEAITLQQIHYLSLRSEDGWVRNTVKEWREVFPFWGRRTIERVLAKLRDDDLIIASEEGDAWDRGLSYRVNDDRVRQIGGVESTESGSPVRQGGGLSPRQSGGLTRAHETSELQLQEEETETDVVVVPVDTDPVEVVWARYTELFGSTFVLTGERRKLIKAALAVRSVEECCNAIAGLSVSEYHVEHGYRDIKYALRGGGHSPSPDATIDRMAGEWAKYSATNGNGRVVRLAHSTADLSIYNRGIEQA